MASRARERMDLRRRFPAVDDRLVADGARAEIVRGKLIMVPPAREPHGTTHLTLAYLLAGHVKRGFVGAVDMLTRTSDASDFAPDASVFPVARDARSGGRQLEHLAFEVSDRQPLGVPTTKARELVRRGVRRVFCIVLRQRRVLEWSRATDAWSPLHVDGMIDDPCFATPLPVRALLETGLADGAVVAALDARSHPAIMAIEARGETRGELSGRVASLLRVLAARALVPSARDLVTIRAATDPVVLDRWLVRAVTAQSVAAVLRSPRKHR